MMGMNRRRFFSALAGGVAALVAVPKVFSKPTGLAFHKDAFTMAPVDIRRKQIHWAEVFEAPKIHPYHDGPVWDGDIITVPGIFYPGTTTERFFMVSSGKLYPGAILRKGSPYYNADADPRLYEIIEWED